MSLSVGPLLRTASSSSLGCITGEPFASMMTSPASIPARAAGAARLDLGHLDGRVDVVEDQFGDGTQSSAGAAAADGAAGAGVKLPGSSPPSLTSTRVSLPLRVSRTVRVSVAPLLRTTALNASAPVMGTPLAATMTSPGSRPAFCPGLSG